MLSYEEALDIILRTLAPLPAEDIALPEALGRALAEAVPSRWDMPPADNSAMDGFAFAAAGLAPQGRLKVAGLSRAGAGFPGPVLPGEAVKIMTGAPLPEGCDTVVPIEVVEEVAGVIEFRSSVPNGDHVRYQGEEFRQGETLLGAGTTLRAGEIGLLASAGVARVRVHRQPRVALLTTGDELVDIGVRPGPGQIVNSNRYLLTARLQEEGCTVWPLEIAGDQRSELTDRLAQGLQADVLITTGGVSMGDYDLVQSCLKDLGFELGFWKVAIKPGKPVLFGRVGDKPVFGLPGNPAAAAATFQLFVRPALRRLCGYCDPLPPRSRATLTAPVSGGGNRRQFLWGAVVEEDGRYLFTPSGKQGSGQTRSLQGAQALLPVAAGSGDLAAGQEVEIMLIYLPGGAAS
ncbi:molybdopterin molybdenumtransferase MoeA [Desulfuromonas versatilis]|uniref:Molybdopterin molybdenumtransferase n=1 Tax=Desulfuromonas versatilis TaxID=2802975 RepID=A0ABM8HRY5_9BACT|nr:gephyrin-like molybdotransferase Glp [Desulfuromonas versatilis]BCR03709.1 molybdopterin molybdenumtransferase MoeA [Desulfuromonas versatilis]